MHRYLFRTLSGLRRHRPALAYAVGGLQYRNQRLKLRNVGDEEEEEEAEEDEGEDEEEEEEEEEGEFEEEEEEEAEVVVRLPPLPPQTMKEVRREVIMTCARDTIEQYQRERGSEAVSVAVSVDGRMVLNRGFGFSDIENGTPASADLRVPAPGVSKLFAVHCWMKLMERQQRSNKWWCLKLHDVIGTFPETVYIDAKVHKEVLKAFKPRFLKDRKPTDDFVKWSFSDNYQIPFHWILTGQSGLAEHYRFGRGVSPIRHHYNSCSQVFADIPDRFKIFHHLPGTASCDSDMNDILLGVAMEKFGDADYRNLALVELQSLGMNDSSFLEYSQLEKDCSEGYWRFKKKYDDGDTDRRMTVGVGDQVMNGVRSDLSYNQPSYGLVATAADLVKFGNICSHSLKKSAKAIERKRGSLSPQAMSQMWSKFVSKDKEDPKKTDLPIKRTANGLMWKLESTSGKRIGLENEFEFTARREGRTDSCGAALAVTFVRAPMDRLAFFERHATAAPYTNHCLSLLNERELPRHLRLILPDPGRSARIAKTMLREPDPIRAEMKAARSVHAIEDAKLLAAEERRVEEELKRAKQELWERQDSEHGLSELAGKIADLTADHQRRCRELVDCYERDPLRHLESYRVEYDELVRRGLAKEEAKTEKRMNVLRRRYRNALEEVKRLTKIGFEHLRLQELDSRHAAEIAAVRTRLKSKAELLNARFHKRLQCAERVRNEELRAQEEDETRRRKREEDRVKSELEDERKSRMMYDLYLARNFPPPPPPPEEEEEEWYPPRPPKPEPESEGGEGEGEEGGGEGEEEEGEGGGEESDAEPEEAAMKTTTRSTRSFKLRHVCEENEEGCEEDQKSDEKDEEEVYRGEPERWDRWENGRLLMEDAVERCVVVAATSNMGDGIDHKLITFLTSLFAQW